MPTTAIRLGSLHHLILAHDGSRLPHLPCPTSPRRAMPPRFVVSAPKCAKCGKSVYQAEQVIGPSAKPYHKPCLACSVCDKRLDSTLLVEHDGLPFCKNCHKAHLGQGKGGFGLAVPLRPEVSKPAAKQSFSNPSHSSDATTAARERRRQEDDVNEQLSGINLSRREDRNMPVAPRQYDDAPPRSSPQTRQQPASRPVASIDDMVASGMEVPMLRGRNGDTSRNEVFQSMYGEGEVDRDAGQNVSSLATAAPSRRPDLAERPTASAQPPSFARSSSPLRRPMPPAETPTTPSRDIIGSVRLGADGLPAPSRRDPIALSRERERGLGGGSSGTAKTYSPRTTPQTPPASRSPRKGDDDDYAYSPASALSKMGLGSTINAAAVGTPLCARCERPVCECKGQRAGCSRC